MASRAALPEVGKSSVRVQLLAGGQTSTSETFHSNGKHSWSLLGFRRIPESPAPCKACCAHLVPTLPWGHQAGIRKWASAYALESQSINTVRPAMVSRDPGQKLGGDRLLETPQA